MPYARNGSVQLYYEEFGSTQNPTLVMIEGYTAQLVGWKPEFLQTIADQGIHVVAFDNRDVGLSSQCGTPEQINQQYTLADMAQDARAVAQSVGAEQFHILGGSMGGMITQEAITHFPEDLLSATLLFTAPSFSDPQWMASAQSSDSGSSEGLDAVDSREEAIDMFVSRERACHVGSVYEFDEQWARKLGGITYDRCYRPDGWRRQNAATQQFSANQEALSQYDRPVALIHGTKDPFFSQCCAIRYHELFENSELHIYPGMAHEVPRSLWDDFVRIIARTVKRGEAVRQS